MSGGGIGDGTHTHTLAFVLAFDVNVYTPLHVAGIYTSASSKATLHHEHHFISSSDCRCATYYGTSMDDDVKGIFLASQVCCTLLRSVVRPIPSLNALGLNMCLGIRKNLFRHKDIRKLFS